MKVILAIVIVFIVGSSAAPQLGDLSGLWAPWLGALTSFTGSLSNLGAIGGLLGNTTGVVNPATAYLASLSAQLTNLLNSLIANVTVPVTLPMTTPVTQQTTTGTQQNTTLCTTTLAPAVV